MTKQQFNKLMDKHLNGSASPEEEEELFAWYDTFQQKNAETDALTALESAALLQKIKTQISNGSVRRKTYFYWPGIAAAAVLILLGTALIFKKNGASTANQMLSILTHKDKKHHVTLPDGTLVWLNANSKLKYPALFSSSKRELWLSGEGYFEVKHDSKRPFIVHTDDIDIKVLGTIFNLKAYPDHETEASLLKGSVEVTVNHGKKRKVILKPFQKLIAADSDVPDQKNQAVTVERIAQEEQAFIAETAWTKVAFSFRNERFQDITAKLEKVYGIKIIIQNPAYNEERFTGTFDNASISTVLNALQFSNEFEYRKEGEEKIIIY